MPFCPKCGTSYREGFGTCAECHVALVAHPPRRNEPYAPAWKDLANRELFLLVFAVGGFFAFAIAHLLEFQSTAGVLLVAWFIGCGIINWYVRSWKCPRCGEPYVPRWSRWAMFRNECQNCSLPRGALNEFGRLTPNGEEEGPASLPARKVSDGKCPGCGAPTSADSEFCDQCGRRLREP